MPEDRGYCTLDFTETFLQTFTAKDFSPAERRAFIRALRRLDDDRECTRPLPSSEAARRAHGPRTHR